MLGFRNLSPGPPKGDSPRPDARLAKAWRSWAIQGHDPIFAAFAEHERAKEAAEELAWKSASDLNDAMNVALNSAGLTQEDIFTRKRIEAKRKIGQYLDWEYQAALAALDRSETEFQKTSAAIDEAEMVADCASGSAGRPHAGAILSRSSKPGRRRPGFSCEEARSSKLGDPRAEHVSDGLEPAGLNSRTATSRA